MGTLSDITSKANTMIRRSSSSGSSSSKGYRQLHSPEKENATKLKSPRYMTPTFASKQSTDTRASTPISASLKAGKANSKRSKQFLRRVGLKRGPPTPPKSVSPRKNMSLPDKIAASVYERPPLTPPSPQKKPEKVITPQDKPLPSPPSAYLDTSSPPKASRNLIDAEAKPLRRHSPDGMEDWPVINPRRVVSASPIQDVMRETGAELRKLSTANPITNIAKLDGERYPKLGDLTQSPDVRSIYHHHNDSPLTKDIPAVPTNTPEIGSSMPLRKGVSTPELSAAKKKMTVSIVSDPFDESPTKRASDLSATAAALEKSKTMDSWGGVRQTRTSSLRARLSAGEVVRDGKGKVTGFTDFTAIENGGSQIPRRGSLNAAGSKTVRKESSLESIGRAPAKFIAGARRVARRASKSGLNNEETVVVSFAPDEEDSTKSADREMRKATSKDGRRSSIPVPKSTGPNLPIPVSAGTPDSRRTTSSYARDSTGFDDMEQMQAVRVAMQQLGDKKATMTDVPKMKPLPSVTGSISTNNGAVLGRGLGSIEESPRHTYTTRRLSTKSPEFGPTLTISSSARRYIMGDDKENASPSRASGPTQGKISAATKKRLERPQSVQSPTTTTNSTHRHEEANKTSTKEKKTRSVDFVSPDKAGGSGLSKNPSNASTIDRPFYDADDGTPPAKSAGINRASNVSIAQEEGWISPLKPRFSPTQEKEEITATLPQKIAARDSIIDDYDPFNYSIATPTEHKAKLVQEELKTPTQLAPPATSSYPPRSSSHEYKHRPAPINTTKTISANATTREVGPLTPRTAVPATPPREFVRRQNQLGSKRGYGSSQLELQDSPPTLKASQPPTAHVPPTRGGQTNGAATGLGSGLGKRNSIVGSVSSLQPSGSRSRFNFKGLFKKGSQDAMKPSGAKKTSVYKKTNANNTVNLLAGSSGRRKASTPPSIRTNGFDSAEKPGSAGREAAEGLLGDVHPLHRTIGPTMRESPRTSTFGISTSSPALTNEVMATPPPPSNTPAPILVRASTRPMASGIKPSTATDLPPTTTDDLSHLTNGTHHANPTTSTMPPRVNTTTPTQSYDLNGLTHHAITLLDHARNEPPSSPRKRKLLDLGKVLVDVITQAREAEAAVSECELALRKAEVARQGVWEGVRLVEELIDGA